MDQRPIPLTVWHHLRGWMFFLWYHKVQLFIAWIVLGVLFGGGASLDPDW